MRKAFDSYSKNLTTYPTTEIDDPEEDLYKVRTAFAYTAFYVYYDQYTLITGILCTNVLIAMGTIIAVLQMF